MKVEFFRHNVGIKDIENVVRVLSSLSLTSGPEVKFCESKLTEYLGYDMRIGDSAMLSSCTAALHLALLAVGVKPGDEVITTPLTFVATSLAIMHSGATPVWVDVDPDTGNMNVDLIESKITDKTSCILPVHLYGNMCDMVRIKRIADSHKLSVVEDCAHALEGHFDGVRVGQLSDAACFSFYATKSITCGDGGAVYSKRKDVIESIRSMRTHGMSKDAYQRQTGLPFWDLLGIGFKYNMTDIQAAVLSSQIDRISELHSKREKNYRAYESILSANKNWDGYLIRWPSFHRTSGYHLFTIRVDPKLRDGLVVHLKNNDIGVGVHYRSINTLTKMRQMFGADLKYPISERIGESTISLPLYPSLTEDEIQYVCEKVFEFFRNH